MYTPRVLVAVSCGRARPSEVRRSGSMANILDASMPLQQCLLLRRLFVLLVMTIVFNMLLLPGAAAGPLKYAHSSLVSALTGRPSSSYGSLTSGSGGVGLGDAEDDADSGDAVAAAAALEGSGGNGGEVLVPKTFPMSPQEPTCEQLRAMWIFSKRQSRAAEMTNEIPTYRDPFAYNIWEPYYSTTRSMGALRVLPRYSERSRSPVFGRVVSREPLLPQRISIGHRQRHYSGDGSGDGGGSRIYGAESKAGYPTVNGGANVRRPSQYRYLGANGSAPNGAVVANPNSMAVQGSFQKLKELIWTERAKELTQQRRAEELAARAAVLKEIANGQNILTNYKTPFKAESSLMDENRSPDLESYQHDGRTSIANGQSYGSTSKNYNNKNNNNNADNNSNNKNYNNNKNNRGSSGTKSHNINKNGGSIHKNNGGGNKELGMYTATGSGMVGRPAVGGNSAAALAGSSTRSFGASNVNSNIMNNNKNNNRAQQKSFFAGNFDSNSGRLGRLMLPGVVASGYGSEEVGLERELEHNYGIPKSYAVRPSHFRERNRSLFKQRSPADYFERDVRNPEALRNYRGKENLSIGQLIGNLNRRNRVPSSGSYNGGDDVYRTGLDDMFSTEPRLLDSDNALSSSGLLGLVDGINIDDDNIEAFLDYIDPVVSLMAYQGNNANEQSGELNDYNSYY